VSLPAFQTFNTPDRLLTKLQQNVSQVLSALGLVPIVGGALCTYTVPAGGVAAGKSFTVNQGLGQAVKAVFPASGAASWFTISSTTSTTVVLTTSAALAPGLTLYFWLI
jgi:hypothetical protein